MENTDGQRMLTSLPEASDDSSQNEHNGANHGDDRERQSKTMKKPGEPGDEPDPLRITEAVLSPFSYRGHRAFGTVAVSIVNLCSYTVTSAVTLPLMLPTQSTTSLFVCLSCQKKK